jgi:hypothetical protein
LLLFVFYCSTSGEKGKGKKKLNPYQNTSKSLVKSLDVRILEETKKDREIEFIDQNRIFELSLDFKSFCIFQLPTS